MMTKLTLEQILTLKQQGYTNRQIAREFLGRESRESWIRLQLKRAQENMSEIVGEATERFLEEHPRHQLPPFIDDFEETRFIDVPLSQILGRDLARCKTSLSKGGVQRIEIRTLPVFDPFRSAANVEEVVGHSRLAASSLP